MSIANAAADPEPLDLSTVTAVTVRVTRPVYPQPAVWVAIILTQTSTLIELEKVFELADVEAFGAYRIEFLLTVPGGVRRAGPVTLNVEP